MWKQPESLDEFTFILNKKPHIACNDTHLGLKWDLEWDFEMKNITPLSIDLEG